MTRLMVWLNADSTPGVLAALVVILPVLCGVPLLAVVMSAIVRAIL